MMGVSRRARKRTNRGYSKDKDKILVKKQNTKHKKQAEGGHRCSKSFVRSFVPSISHLLSSVFRASSPSLRRFSSLGLRSVNSFFLHFRFLIFACSHRMRGQSTTGSEWKGVLAFFVCKGGCYFFFFPTSFPPFFPLFLLFLPSFCRSTRCGPWLAFWGECI